MLNEHLKALTKSPLQQAFIVHRLDRETSGLMMFARSRALQAALQENWKTVTKNTLPSSKASPQSAKARCAIVSSRAGRYGCIASSAAACWRSLTIESYDQVETNRWSS